MPAVKALYNIRNEFKHLIQVSEFRVMKGCDIPMSPARGVGPTVGFHFTWVRNHNELVRVLPKLEKELMAFGARPHFGKLFVLNGNYFQDIYREDIKGLRDLMEKHDPKGKLRNDYIKQYIYGKDNLGKL